MILRRLGLRSVEKPHLGPGARQLFHEQRLVDLAPREAIRRIAEDHPELPSAARSRKRSRPGRISRTSESGRYVAIRAFDTAMSHMDRHDDESGRIGSLVLYLMGVPVGLLILLWVLLGNNIFGPG